MSIYELKKDKNYLVVKPPNNFSRGGRVSVLLNRSLKVNLASLIYLAFTDGFKALTKYILSWQQEGKTT
jgi:hypothetical protein